MSGLGLLGNESPQTVANFRDQTGVTFPLLLNDTSKSKLAYPDGVISPYPIDVIIDKQGTIRYLRHDYDPAAMDETIQKLLAEDP
jgi:peroxiredoxin